MYKTGKGYSTFFFNLTEEAEIEYWDFEKCRDFIRPLWFYSNYEYRIYSYHSYQQRRYGGENFINRNNIECPMKPAEIPDDLKRYYKDEWTNYIDFFLGDAVGKELYIHYTDATQKEYKIYYTYEAACKYVQQLKFKTIEDYIYWETKSKKARYQSNNHIVNLPSGTTMLARSAFLPIIPNVAYKADWVCIQEYIGLPYTNKTMYRKKKGSGQLKNDNNFKSRDLVSYREARDFVRTCKLGTVKEYTQWRLHSKVSTIPFITQTGLALPPFPKFLPHRPLEYYKKQCKEKHTWVSWYDFLGLKYNKNHDQEIENLMNRASQVFYRSVNKWMTENNLKGKGLRIHAYIGKQIRNNAWDGWADTLNCHNSTKCSFQEAKILLSFKKLSSIQQYNKWRCSVGSPFFLPVLASEEHLAAVYPSEQDASVSNFLSVDLSDKIETQAKSTPVLAISIVKEQHILVNVVKQGKFEAFIQYHNKPSCYVFDLYDKNILAHIIQRHCEHTFGGNVYYVKHMGYLYQDLINNFKLINLARIYD
jgi:hypothetical protein